ncbi:hypothetical protein ACQFYA_08880 [Promicromonospora sp. Marseille-Q5078]
MPARAVVLPATPLLVPGAGGGADRLGEVRRVVDDALDRLLRGRRPGDGGDGPLVVLAPVPRGAAGRTARLRPSLAGAGVRDRWVPAVAAWPVPDDPAAHVPASVALVALRAALDRAVTDRSALDRSALDRSALDRAALERAALERGVDDLVEHPGRPDVLVVEVARGEAVAADGAAALRDARGIVVAGGVAPGTPGATAEGRPDLGQDPDQDPGQDLGQDPDLDPAVAAALDGVAAPGSWTWRVTAVPGGHEHLPGAYVVATGVAGP